MGGVAFAPPWTLTVPPWTLTVPLGIRKEYIDQSWSAPSLPKTQLYYRLPECLEETLLANPHCWRGPRCLYRAVSSREWPDIYYKNTPTCRPYRCTETMQRLSPYANALTPEALKCYKEKIAVLNGLDPFAAALGKPSDDVPLVEASNIVQCILLGSADQVRHSETIQGKKIARSLWSVRLWMD